jgi:hypothetical protein
VLASSEKAEFCVSNTCVILSVILGTERQHIPGPTWHPVCAKKSYIKVIKIPLWS